MEHSTYFTDVRAFHLAAGQPAPGEVTMQDDGECDLRMNLIDEEHHEAISAILTLSICADAEEQKACLVSVAKELADLVYVALGTAVSLGIPFDAVWAEVHASNMAKFDGEVRRDASGKVLKPDGWQAPDIRKVIFGEVADAS